MKHDETVLKVGCPSPFFLSINEEENLSKFFDARHETRNPVPMMPESRSAGKRSVGVIVTIFALMAAVGFVVFEKALAEPSQISPATAHAVTR